MRNLGNSMLKAMKQSDHNHKAGGFDYMFDLLASIEWFLASKVRGVSRVPFAEPKPRVMFSNRW